MQIQADALQAMRNYFKSGATMTYAFRKKQLLALRSTVLKYQDAISEALYADLKKSEEESFATETGLFLTEVNFAIKNLRRWMQPKYVSSNLLNLPSSNRIYRDPLGVVLIIAPWNYPFQLLMIPLVGALAGGNCAIVKPSELAPATASIVERILNETFSATYVKTTLGDGAIIVPALITNFRFDHIFYTGSIDVGRSIYQMAAADLVPVTLELGGKSPAIIEEDANLPVAARRIALGKFLNAGQTCVAPDYLLLHQNVKDQFMNLLKKAITEFYTDDPSSSNDFCKIINKHRHDKLVSFLSQGKIVYGGAYNRETLYMAPTLMEEVSMETSLMKEEIFGPILPLFSFNTREEAFSVVSRNANPLAFYLFTNNNEAEKEWISRLRFGGGCVNNAVWQVANHHLPFGGVG
ncbi:MAG: aldehyde dehydrogenase family protein [Chitinophagaceae bacterium]